MQAILFSLISLGLSIGGSGFLGVPVQFRPNQHVAIEMGIYGRAAYFGTDAVDQFWYFNPAFDASANIYFGTNFKSEKNRTITNGFYLHGGLFRSDLDQEMIGLGWVREIKNQSAKGFLQLKVGPSANRSTLTYLNTRYPPGYQEYTDGPRWTPMIHARLTWYFGLL